MKSKLIGLGLFLFIAAGAVAYHFLGGGEASSSRGPAIAVKGYVGGEKMGFFADEQVQKILKNRYNITVDAVKAGSIEMVSGSTEGMNFLFPSSQTALEIFTALGKSAQKKESILSSPIVFYSWTDISNALEREGIVQKRDGVSYIVDLAKFVAYIKSNQKWSDHGLNLYGAVKVISTDPAKSNSGNMYAALLANTLNGGTVVDESTIGNVLPDLKSIFAVLGQMESSSGNLFTRYLKLGMGDSPMIAGYENQIVEFALENPELWNAVKNRVAVLYPEPTIISQHYLIALDEKGTRLCDALLDPEIQKIAWQRHGFRTSMISHETDAAIMDTVGIPDNLTQIIPMPVASVMEKIISALSGQ